MSTALQHTLIRASAGSGKTYQLANRYLALLLLQAESGQVSPERLVAITFTRKGAGEFADRILRRLALAAGDARECEKLRNDLDLLVSGDPRQGIVGLAPGIRLSVDTARLQSTLAVMADEFDRLVLGTIDSFMARSVQTLAFELGLDGFEILEEPAAERTRRKLLAEVFREASEQSLEAFYYSVKLATLKSASSLLQELDDFVSSYHKLILHLPEKPGWGGTGFWSGAAAGTSREEAAAAPAQAKAPASESRHPWRAEAQQLLAKLPTLPWESKEVLTRLTSCLEWLAQREPGLPTSTKPLPSWLTSKKEEGEDRPGKLLELWPAWPEVWECYPRANSKKPCVVPATVMAPLKSILSGWVAAERQALAAKTAAIYEIVVRYERCYELHARRKGRLSFDDVPLLLSEQQAGEAAQQALAKLGLRWFQQFDHWLLDEFQDTSRVQWGVLKPWLDEAIQDYSGTKSVFVVGDPKQSIYGWRGGEPRLFNELQTSYPGAFQEQVLAQSWRSRPAVLELANRVCNPDQNEVLRDPARFLAPALNRWRYDVHVPEPSRTDQPGYAAVLLAHAAESVEAEDGTEASAGGGDSADKLAAQASVIKAVLDREDPLGRGLSCAVLVRKNQNAQAVAQWLRANGVAQVMVEGDTTLADQAPVVAAIVDGLRWLHTPAHTLAEGHARTTPLWEVLVAPFAHQPAAFSAPGNVWRYWRRRVSDSGAGEVTRAWCRELLKLARDPYNRYCLRQVDEFASQAGGRLTLPDWILTLEALKVRETAAAGCLHVMTIHKAKGLGFDVVFLPDLDLGGARPEEVLLRRDAQGRTVGCLAHPAKWLRAWVPTLEQLKSAQEAEQDLEALCVLYVALTRSKEATFVILNDEPPRLAARTRDWLLGGFAGATPVPSPWHAGSLLWESGDRQLVTQKPNVDTPSIVPQHDLRLPKPSPRLERRRPSEAAGEKGAGPVLAQPGALPEVTGQEFGSAVHAVFAQIEWWNPSQELRGAPPAIAEVAECLKIPEIRALFTADSPADEACRELPVEWAAAQTWWSGVVDRLVLRHNADGTLRQAVLIDFKTDRNASAEALLELYSEQCALYRQAVALALNLKEPSIETILVSTHQRQVIRIAG